MDTVEVELEDGGLLEFDLNSGVIRFYNETGEFEFKFTPDSPEYSLCKDEYFPNEEIFSSGVEFSPFSDLPMFYSDNVLTFTPYQSRFFLEGV